MLTWHVQTLLPGGGFRTEHKDQVLRGNRRIQKVEDPYFVERLLFNA